MFVRNDKPTFDAPAIQRQSTAILSFTFVQLLMMTSNVSIYKFVKYGMHNYETTQLLPWSSQ